MSLDNVKPGKKIPESFNVIIEIPMNADTYTLGQYLHELSLKS